MKSEYSPRPKHWRFLEHYQMNLVSCPVVLRPEMCLKDLLAVLKDLLAVPRVSAGLPAMVSPGTVLIFEVDPYC